jgi:hypothetical protein
MRVRGVASWCVDHDRDTDVRHASGGLVELSTDPSPLTPVSSDDARRGSGLSGQGSGWFLVVVLIVVGTKPFDGDGSTAARILAVVGRRGLSSLRLRLDQLDRVLGEVTPIGGEFGPCWYASGRHPSSSATRAHDNSRCSRPTGCSTDTLSSAPNHLPFWRRQPHWLTRHKIASSFRAEVGKSVNPVSCFRVSPHTLEAAAL